MAKDVQIKENELLSLLKKDTNLLKNLERQMLYISFANMYIMDFKENLGNFTLELDDKYHTSDPDGWRKFLAYPPVKAYIDEFLDEIMDKQSTAALAATPENQGVALATKKLLASKNTKTDNSQIMVWRIGTRVIDRSEKGMYIESE